jgi:hypothetical protein
MVTLTKRAAQLSAEIQARWLADPRNGFADPMTQDSLDSLAAQTNAIAAVIEERLEKALEAALER